MAAKQGFLMYYSKGDAIGTRVSVRYRRSGRLSEVVVKRGSTVSVCHVVFHNFTRGPLSTVNCSNFTLYTCLAHAQIYVSSFDLYTHPCSFYSMYYSWEVCVLLVVGLRFTAAAPCTSTAGSLACCWLAPSRQ